MKTNILRKLALGICVFLYAIDARAIVETYTTATVKLSTIAGALPNFRECYDTKLIPTLPFTGYTTPGAIYNTDFTFRYIRNSFKISIDRSNTKFFNIARNIRVKYYINGKYANNVAFNLGTVGVPLSMDLKFNPLNNQVEDDAAVYAFENAVWFKVTIVGITDFSNVSIAGTFATQYPEVNLDYTTEFDRIYKFDMTAASASPFKNSVVPITYPFIMPAVPCTDLYEIRWNNIPSAEAWEIEWQFVEDNIVTVVPNFTTIDFRNNATRVRIAGFNTPSPSYKIPGIYPSGFIIYRVRAIGKDMTSYNEVFAPWSMDDVTNNYSLTFMTNNTYKTVNYNEDINWVRTIDFVDDGQYKNMISYYDGVFRNRESITLNSTDNMPIIAQTMYDYTGRPVIQVLPTPALDNNNGLCFRRNFNNSAGTAEAFNFLNFDLTSGTACADPLKVYEMNNAKGAARYYSTAGYGSYGISLNSWQAFVPDANGYPFTQVEYTPDNTDRVSRKSDVGPVHRLSGVDQNTVNKDGKETKIYYGKPLQEQLDLMFGYEAGKAEHYKRNIQIDANGQASVTYLDPYGKTIATSLMGNQAISNLVSLPSSSQGYNIKAKLLNNKLDVQNQQKIIEEPIRVIDPTMYYFEYTIDARTFSPECTPEGVCFDCVYDMEISLKKNGCDDQLIPDASRKAMVGNIEPFDLNCNAVSFTLAPSPLAVLLQPGQYTLVKTLKVNKKALDYYKEQYWSHNTCLKSLSDFIEEEKDRLNVDQKCLYSCKECNDDLNELKDRKSALQALGGSRTEEENTEYAAIDGKITGQQELCDELCHVPTPCEILFETILADVRPGGQYAPLYTYDEVTGVLTDAYSDANSILNESNTLMGSCSTKNWRNPKNPSMFGSTSDLYYNEDGTQALIPVENGFPAIALGKSYYKSDGTVWVPAINVPRFARPQDLLTVQDFVKFYQSNPSWAYSLRYYHPEYCYYLKCKYVEPTYIYNNKLLAENDGEAAKVKGYYNPVNMGDLSNNGVVNTSPYVGVEVSPERDPLYTTPLNIGDFDATHKTAFQNHLFDYPINTTGVNKSIWDLYNDMVTFDNLDPDDKDCAGDPHWPFLRALYIAAKDDILRDYYKSSTNCSALSIQCPNCPSGVTCIGEITIPAGRMRRFPLDGSSLGDLPISLGSGDDDSYDNGSDMVQARIGDYCVDKCESYRERWREQLSTCSAFTGLSGANQTALLDALKLVCVNGCDENNLLGSREMDPRRILDHPVGTPTNFQEVLDKYFSIANPLWLTPGICDELVLEWPMGYDHDEAAYNDPNADTCACNKKDYAKINPNCVPNDIPAPLNSCACDIKNTNLRHAKLSSMDIPAELKCQNCVDCKQLNMGYNTFVERYSVSTISGMSDQVFEDLLEEWMNIYLGFNLEYVDYLVFAGKCSHNETPARSVWSTYEKVKWSALDKQNNNQIKFLYDEEPLYWAADVADTSLSDHAELKWGNVPKVSNDTYGEMEMMEKRAAEAESYVYASSDNTLMYAAVTSSPNADKLACHCEKILTARYYREKDGGPISDADMYKKLFGSNLFPTQPDFDKAYKVCCNAFNLNDPPVSGCNHTDFKPGDKFSAGQKDYFDNKVLSPNTHPVFTSGDFQMMLDNACDNPLQADNKLKKLDKCACDKLLTAKKAYDLAYPGQYDNPVPPNPTFETYLYNTQGVTATNFKYLVTRCNEFYESGSGIDNTGNPRQWPSTALANWKKVALENLSQFADDDGLQVPEKLLCGPPPLPPCKSFPPDCNAMKWVLKEFLASTSLPIGVSLGNPYDPVTQAGAFTAYNYYNAWENFYELYMSNKSAASPDPALTAFFDAFAAYANSNTLVKMPCPANTTYTASELIQRFMSCLPQPCRPSCEDFVKWFNYMKQAAIDGGVLPAPLSGASSMQDFYNAAKTNYYTDPDMTQMVDNFLLQMNTEIKKKCPKANRDVEYSFSQVWNMMWHCFSWPLPPKDVPGYVEKPKCTSCYEINYPYLKAFQGFLNQIDLGGNSHTAVAKTYNKIHFDDWLLYNPIMSGYTGNTSPGPGIQVTDFYSSILYTGSSAATLRYHIDEDSYGVPYMEAEVYDAGGFKFSFSLEYPEDKDIFNYGYIKEFKNIKPLGRVNCGLPRGFEVDAVIIVPPAYPGVPGPQTIRMSGSFIRGGGYAGYATCLDTCVRLCNRPRLPEIVTIDPCEKILKRIAYTNGMMKYNDYKEKINKKFEADYRSHCLGVGENFTMEFNQKEYHFSLYYYDQSGNLIKSVPPEGVDFTHSGLTPTQRAQLVDERIRMAADFRSPAPVIPGSHKPFIYHTLITHYKYNTLDQLVWQKTPDAGEAKNWYDNLGRNVVSQNARQAAGNLYSYVLYDALGRRIETGEKNTVSTMDYATAGSSSSFLIFLASGTNRQISRTLYDEADASDPLASAGVFTSTRAYMRQRIASKYYFEGTPPPSPAYKGQTCDAATHYCYDIHGNVNELVEELPALSGVQQQYKKISYEYTLLNNKVKQVHYQADKPDQMHHRYTYDADGRLLQVETSKDNWYYTLDAKQFYYMHGPLARLELGDYNQKVQGLDYAYTLHGWLKSVNGPAINQAKDMGKDGNQVMPYIVNSKVSRDAFASMLHYYDNDYQSVGGGVTSFIPNIPGSNLQMAKFDLYNGNIPFMQTSLPDVTSYSSSGLVVNNSLGNVYRYDQLNRVVDHKVFSNYDLNTNAWLNTPGVNGMDKYYETFAYDPNGNITALTRNGNNAGITVGMDNFTYKYDNINTPVNELKMYFDINSASYGSVYPKSRNQLFHVNDNTSLTSNYTDDMDDQGTFSYSTSTLPAMLSSVNTMNNYGYDASGNLVRDNAEQIATIIWLSNGKIKSITRSGGSSKPDLEFGYNTAGDRLYKTIKPRTGGVLSKQKDWKTKWYVRDQTGNVIATYTQEYQEMIVNQRIKEKLTVNELMLYGSSRLGVYHSDVLLATQDYLISGYNGSNQFNGKSPVSGTSVITTLPTRPTIYIQQKGKKEYELKNHLDNVLVTISDRRIMKDDNFDLIIDYYLADVYTIMDYYAFGYGMPGKKYAYNAAYRYNFNGKEFDSESNTQDYGYRIFNAAIGKFLSMDPLAKKYPYLTPYQFAENYPIKAVDIDGLEANVQFNLSVKFNIDWKRGVSGTIGGSLGFSYTYKWMMPSVNAAGSLYFNTIGTSKTSGRTQGTFAISTLMTCGYKEGQPQALQTVNSMLPTSITNRYGNSLTLGTNFTVNSLSMGVRRYQPTGVVGLKGTVNGTSYSATHANDMIYGTDHGWGAETNFMMGAANDMHLTVWNEIFNGQRISGKARNGVQPTLNEKDCYTTNGRLATSGMVIQNYENVQLNEGRTLFMLGFPSSTPGMNYNLTLGSTGGINMYTQRGIHWMLGYPQFEHNTREFDLLLGAGYDYWQ